LHLWLPPAHANAPAAGSAVLSGLVVKASFFLIVRLWFYVLPAVPSEMPSAILATLGSAAILSGSVLALRQERLKLLIAYSTVAQIGYLFLMFPLASGTHPWAVDAWSGGLMQILSHAFAKAAMFLAAGLVAESLGHDRIDSLGGAGQAMPVTIFAFGLGGLSLMGLPPSGGFAAKWLLLKASVEAGQWLWAAVMLMGGLLAGGRRSFENTPSAKPRGHRPVAGAHRCNARLCATSIVRLSANRPPSRDGGSPMTSALSSAALANTAHSLGPSLLAAALATPIVMLAACLSRKLRRHALALQWLVPLPALAAALLAIGGTPLTFEQPALRVSLRLDAPGAMLLAVVALLWIATSAGVLADVRGKPNAGRFAVCWLLTLTGSLGVFIAADLLTFYLVYALVSIPAFGLIAHGDNAASRRAGGVYMAFTLLGETLC
jgi:formate hydrogenlyase subunit 3/multisubunit Na+/H+ antiporter MnhD subunit